MGQIKEVRISELNPRHVQPSKQKRSEIKVLYVTTFNQKFYEICARTLLNTFLKYAEGTMLACYEDDIQDMPDDDRIIYERIDEDPFMNKWLEENSDIIPIEYGGESKIKFAVGSLNMWNFRASKWFRKIVALNKSLEIYDNYDIIIFIDADSRFHNNLSSHFVANTFKGADMIYHLGDYRSRQAVAGASGIESGLVGFAGHGGREMLGRWVNIFRGGDFRQYPRWDDSYMLRMVVEKSGDLKCRDLMENITSLDSRVMDIGPFCKFIYHDKGKTTRERSF